MDESAPWDMRFGRAQRRPRAYGQRCHSLNDRTFAASYARNAREISSSESSQQ